MSHNLTIPESTFFAYFLVQFEESEAGAIVRVVSNHSDRRRCISFHKIELMDTPNVSPKRTSSERPSLNHDSGLLPHSQYLLPASKTRGARRMENFLLNQNSIEFGLDGCKPSVLIRTDLRNQQELIRGLNKNQSTDSQEYIFH